MIEIHGDIATFRMREHVVIIDATDAALVAQFNWYPAASSKRRSGRYPYPRAAIKRRGVGLHILLMQPPPGALVDHINGNVLDNRRSNLRIVNHRSNSRNASRHIDSLSSFKGLTFRPKKPRSPWCARIAVAGKRIFLGTFKSEVEAALAYDTAAKQFFGEFARLNFPDDVLPPHGQDHGPGAFRHAEKAGREIENA